MSKISVVIPCYNSANFIGKVLTDIETTCKTNPEYDYEIICVCDASPDNVFEVLSDIAKNNKRLKCINLAKNFGQHAALMTGFRYVSGDVIVCMDDDGQTPPSEMFKLIDKLDEGYDAVFAKYSNKQHSGFRNFGSKINDYMADKLIGKPKDLAIMSYFACKRFIIDEIIRYNNPYPYIAGLILRSTKNITNVEIAHQKRIEGKSGYTFGKLFALWINGFTAFSIKPLRFAVCVGCVFSFIGFIFMIYTLINKFFINPDAPMGYTSLMSVVLIIGGLLMLILGMIGEYVGRIYISINNSPQYVVRETVNIGDEK